MTTGGRVAPVGSARDLDDALAIRFRVFVMEQGVPIGSERDEYDRTAFHVLGRDAEGRPVATGRMVEKEGRGKLQRIAVLSGQRGRGWGRKVVASLEAEASRRGLAECMLDAQVTALDFYRELGYQAEGDVFLDCGIEHRRMVRKLDPG